MRIDVVFQIAEPIEGHLLAVYRQIEWKTAKGKLAKSLPFVSVNLVLINNSHISKEGF